MDFDFESLEKERKEIEEFLSRPDAYASGDFAAKSKRGAELAQIFELRDTIFADEKALAEAKELMNDAELSELAKDDVENLTKKLDRKSVV